MKSALLDFIESINLNVGFMNKNKSDRLDIKKSSPEESSPKQKSLNDFKHNDFVENFHKVEASQNESNLNPSESENPQKTGEFQKEPLTNLEPFKLFNPAASEARRVGAGFVDFINGIITDPSDPSDPDDIDNLYEIRNRFKDTTTSVFNKSVNNHDHLENGDWQNIRDSIHEIKAKIEELKNDKKFSTALCLGLELTYGCNLLLANIMDLMPNRQEVMEDLSMMPEIIKKAIPDKGKVLKLIWEVFKVDKMGFSQDWCLNFGENYFQQKDWHTLRKEIESELEIDLKILPRPEDKYAQSIEEFQNRSSRNINIKYLFKVYKESGASDNEILELLRSEANKSDSEFLLADFLEAQGLFAEAATAVQTGYEKKYKYKHIVNPILLEDYFIKLIDLCMRSEQHSAALSLLFEKFFKLPSVEDLELIEQGCQRMDNWDKTKPFIHEFLFNGVHPQQSTTKPATRTWPFPDPLVRSLEVEDWDYFMHDEIEEFLLISVFLKNTELLKQTIDNNHLLKAGILGHGYITQPDYPRLLAEKYPAYALKAWKQFIFAFLEEEYYFGKGPEKLMGFLEEARELFKKQNKKSQWHNLIDEIKKHHGSKSTLIKNISAQSFIEF